jgi:hypothetical protein
LSKFKVKNGINLPDATITTQGDMHIEDMAGLQFYHNSAERTAVDTNSTQTLTGKTLTGNIATNLVSGAATLTLPTSTDTLVGRATTDTLTNKTLTAPVISTISNTGTVTLPTATCTLMGKDTTDTMMNKTFDADGTGNSITNIENADIKAAAAIAVNKLAALTASRIVQTDGSGFISHVDTATYPTLTELSYVKGVTSAVQTQLDGKASAAGSTKYIDNLGLACSVGSNALTIALKQIDGSTDPNTGASAVKVGFRSSTITSGAGAVRSATAAASVVVPSGATLGLASGTNCHIFVYAIDNAGTIELAVSTLLRDEHALGTTTTIGTGADDSGFYSTTGRTDKAFRLIGRLDYTTAPNGTYAATPDAVTLITNNDYAISYDYVSAAITTDTSTVTANTYVDVTGASLVLQPGVWNITASGSLYAASANAGNVAITDSSNNILGTSARYKGIAAGTAPVDLRITKIALTATTTVKIRIRYVVDSGTGVLTWSGAANQTGGLTDPDTQSIFFAERVR